MMIDCASDIKTNRKDLKLRVSSNEQIGVHWKKRQEMAPAPL
jgi:hypothetical protein